MKTLSACLVIATTLVLSSSSSAETQPVRMGTGIMTFDTVPGWGLGDDGKSVLGSTHGGVVVDKKGSIYVSANKGVVVFSPAGKVLREYVGPEYMMMHDIEIR